MSITFKNAPVVEIIAEVRWGAPTFVFGHSTLDALFIRFGAELSKTGFSVFERIVPPEAPVGPYQAIYRYRNNAEEGRLLQLGNCVFVANANPPYQSWETFAPIVKRGVESLLTSLNDQPESATQFNAEKGFSQILLRYVNAFRGAHLQNRKHLEFLSDVLGIKLSLPDPLTRLWESPEAVEPIIQLNAKVEGGLMSISIGSGMVNNETALLFDISLLAIEPIAANVDDVMNRLAKSRQVIHELFIKLTSPIHDVMQPEKQDD